MGVFLFSGRWSAFPLCKIRERNVTNLALTRNENPPSMGRCRLFLGEGCDPEGYLIMTPGAIPAIAGGSGGAPRARQPPAAPSLQPVAREICGHEEGRIEGGVSAGVGRGPVRSVLIHLKSAQTVRANFTFQAVLVRSAAALRVCQHLRPPHLHPRRLRLVPRPTIGHALPFPEAAPPARSAAPRWPPRAHRTINRAPFACTAVEGRGCSEIGARGRPRGAHLVWRGGSRALAKPPGWPLRGCSRMK